jgi:hypothetical protein
MVTSATSILVLDGLSTQAVVQALERHAAPVWDARGITRRQWESAREVERHQLQHL